MSKKNKKIEEKDTKTTKGATASELSEQELDKVAGGGAGTPINGAGVGLGNNKNKPPAS